MPIRERRDGEIEVPVGHPLYGGVTGNRYMPLCHQEECQWHACNPDNRFLQHPYRQSNYPCAYNSQPPAPAEPLTGEDLEPIPMFSATDEPPAGRHWIRAGVELEGGWNRSRRALEPIFGRKGHIKGDGSVSVNASGHIGEFSTRPYRDVNALWATVNQAYPDAVNDTCGMHVHTSWTLGDYVKLADKRFHPFFREKMRLFAESLPNGRAKRALQARLAGSNHFCQVNQDTDGERHLKQEPVDRYRQLNYCWYRHNTLECRLLPMFDTKEGAVAAIKKLLNIYEEWLNNYGDLPDAEPKAIEADASTADPIVKDISGRAVDSRIETDGYTLVHDDTEVDPYVVAPTDMAVMSTWSEDAISYLIQDRIAAQADTLARQVRTSR